MRKFALLILLVLAGCATRTALTPTSSLAVSHPQPWTVFGVGYWTKQVMVLTVTDSRKDYFVIKVPRNDSLKVGSIYKP